MALSKPIVISLVVALCLTALLLVFLTQRESPDAFRVSDPVQQLTTATQPDAPLTTTQQATRKTGTPQQHDAMVISPSLAGTDIDGALRATADGQLILDIGVRDFFDYFLSTADEIGVETAIDEVVRYIQTYLPHPANDQALSLFESYLRFKRFEFGVHQTPITDATLTDAKALDLLRENMTLLRTHRQSLFSAEQDQALFGLQDTYAEHTLASLQLMADDSLSDEQKLVRMAQLKQQLPPELQASMDETLRGRRHQQEIESLVNAELDDAQLHQSLVQQGFTQAKADEVVSHRQQQRQFESDYRAYTKARAQLKPESDSYTNDLAQLRARFFPIPEHLTKAKLRDMKVE